MFVDTALPISKFASCPAPPDGRLVQLASPLSPTDITKVYTGLGLNPTELFQVGIHTDMKGELR